MKTARVLPQKFLAAMIAVLPLPGSPLYNGDDQKVIDQALADLETYKAAGVDSIIFENDHDLPYIQPPLDEKGVALMTKIAKQARERFDGPIGVQMLEAANITSLEIAAEADLDYIRVEAFVFAHVGGSGIINGSAGKILRKRKELGAEHIKVFADVKKKHGSHSLTIDLDIRDEIMQAEFFLADGVIVTSQFTGINPSKDDLIKAKRATQLPVLIGSGMTAENIVEYLPLADGFIVGSYFRRGAKFLELLEPDRLHEFMQVFVPERNLILGLPHGRNTDPFEYDVALSFAEEDRARAEELGRLLISRNLTVFSDEYQAAHAERWGMDIVDHLVNLYARKARYCLLFISGHYPLHKWTKPVRNSAQQRALRDAQEYILPIRLDDTEVPGINETPGYRDLRQHSLESVADFLMQKWEEARDRSGPSGRSHDLRSGNVAPTRPKSDSQ